MASTTKTGNGRHLLTLDSLVDLPTVALPDGSEYELLTIGRMPPLDNHRFIALAERSDELTSKRAITEEEAAELAAIPGKMCRLVLRAPDDVHAKLDDHQRMAIISTFMAPPRMALTEATPTTSPSTGATPSPASSGSTAAPR